jgi:hypothetical protein
MASPFPYRDELVSNYYREWDTKERAATEVHSHVRGMVEQVDRKRAVESHAPARKQGPQCPRTRPPPVPHADRLDQRQDRQALDSHLADLIQETMT